jgi:ABC-2 type transport system permease protein
MSVFPTFIENQSKVMGMISLVPKSALEFKGISNIADLTSILGFYAANNIIYMMVLGSIFSIVLSINILLKEEYNKTAEYLLTKPITRAGIFISKLLAVLLQVLLLNLITASIGIISMEILQKGDINLRAFFILSTYTLLLNLLFGALGLFISTLVKKPKSITTVGIGLVLVFYFLFTLSKITESASKIGYASPFKYVRTDISSENYMLDFWRMIYFLGISIFLIFLSYRNYRRKDIYT